MSLLVDIEKKLGSFTLQARFETQEGITGLLGASGCGKSMTLRCVAGIERPDKGRIVLDGNVLFDSRQDCRQKIDLPPKKRQVGYLFQNYALFPNMTVRQNILTGLFHEKDRQKKEAEAVNIINLLGLNGLESHRPAQLSGGQAQRVALARILVSHPKLLLLDEPFSALDSFLRDQLQLDMMELLRQLGTPALLVTHNRDEAYHMCPHLMLMEKGAVIRFDETKKVFANPGSRYAAQLTGCKNIVSAQKKDDFTIWVPEWGIHLHSSEPVGDTLCGVGIRAHYFNPKSRYNRFPVIFQHQVEEPFEWILQFRFAAQAENTPPVWWRIPKDKKPKEFPEELGIAPENILLLYS